MTRLAPLAVAALIGLAVGATNVGPRLRVDPDTPADLRDLARGTWASFLAAFPARTACIPDVALVGRWTLPDRAEYRPDPPTVLVRIPATARQLEAALVHEFAHHLEFQCPEQAGLRPAFLRSQGMPAGHPWFAGASWEATPSERFAEATVQLVLGDRALRRRMAIGEEAEALIRAWGLGLDPSTAASLGPAPAPGPPTRTEDG